MPSAAASSASLPESSQTPGLALPAATVAALSPHPYLLNHLQRTPPVRPNGRRPSQFRSPACAISSLTHCVGSAVIRTGDTAVTCGIQAEILNANDIADPPNSTQEHQRVSAGQNHDRDARDDGSDRDLSQLGLLVPNIDLATGCSPTHLPGTGPPTLEAQTLSQRLYRLLLSSRVIQLADLQICSPKTAAPTGDTLRTNSEAETKANVEIRGYWTLYISLSVLSLAGTTSLLDSLWAALLAALADVRLPKAWWDADREAILCSDRVEDAHRLRLRGRPLVVSWGVFVGRREDGYMRELGQQAQDADTTGRHGGGDGGDLLDEGKEIDGGRKRAWFLADPDSFEEALCCETVSIVVDCGSGEPQLLRVEKGGGGIVATKELRALARAAEDRWATWDSILPVSLLQATSIST